MADTTRPATWEDVKLLADLLAEEGVPDLPSARRRRLAVAVADLPSARRRRRSEGSMSI